MIMETIVASVVAGSSVCSDHFENVSRFNPTDLSDFQKCVYMSNGTTSGVHSNFFWAEVGGEHYYLPVKDIAGKSKQKIEEMMIDLIIVGQFKAKIAELQAQVDALALVGDGINEVELKIAALNAEINDLELVVAALKGDNETLQGKLDEMTEDRDRIQGLLDQANIDIENLEGLRDQLKSNIEEVFEDYLSDFTGDIFEEDGSLTTEARSALFGFLDQGVADATTLGAIETAMLVYSDSINDSMPSATDDNLVERIEYLIANANEAEAMWNDLEFEFSNMVKFHGGILPLNFWLVNGVEMSTIDKLEKLRDYVVDLQATDSAFQHAKAKMEAFGFFSWDNTLDDDANLSNAIENINVFMDAVDGQLSQLNLVDNALTTAGNNTYVAALTVTDDDNNLLTWGNMDRFWKITALANAVNDLNVKIKEANDVLDGSTNPDYKGTGVSFDNTADNGVSTSIIGLVAGAQYAYTNTPTGVTEVINTSTGASVSLPASLDRVDYSYVSGDAVLADGWYVVFDDGQQNRYAFSVDTQAAAESIVQQVSGGLDLNGISVQGVNIYGSSYTLPTDLAGLKTIIDEVADAAYDAGFESGYSEGYADGYKDGFADGVASVQDELD